jgi:DNA-binding transcriptional ArsR family regulator
LEHQGNGLPEILITSDPAEWYGRFNLRTEERVTTRTDGPFRLSPQATKVDVLAKYFRGFGDPTRLRILDLLRKEERSVGELVAALRQPQPKVSNHLACLRWCGFVAAERRGKRVFYRLSDTRVGEIIDMAGALLDDSEHAPAPRRASHVRVA